ncbi:MAG TPA: GNAT family N-acetyltransferase [Acidimicrobiales bacterium]|nr:GNAT family N-acetyltransferase [Acidimicrobiales bacterium]
MSIETEQTTDPARVLERAGAFLASDPVRHNVILTLLHGRVANPAEGRYLIAATDDEVVGVVFQSPLTFMATMTPMSGEAVHACVEAWAPDPGGLPGIAGEAGTAARFAGHWTERTKSAAFPKLGQRLYEAGTITEPVGVGGNLRRADQSETSLVAGWLRGFHLDIRQPAEVSDESVGRDIATGRFWVWDDDGPASMAALTTPVEGVARVQAVYTPPELRSRGYAAACVGRLSAKTLAAGTRCILYTDLGNPVSNSVYRRLGYRAVAEMIVYDLS